MRKILRAGLVACAVFALVNFMAYLTLEFWGFESAEARAAAVFFCVFLGLPAAVFVGYIATEGKKR